jgi:hypothetical protein
MPAGVRYPSFTALIECEVKNDKVVQVLREMQTFLEDLEKRNVILRPSAHVGRLSIHNRMIGWATLSGGSLT